LQKSHLFNSEKVIYTHTNMRVYVCVITGTATSHCQNSEKVKTADEHTELINKTQTVHRITPELANSFANEFL
jgi:hypothetical protein